MGIFATAGAKLFIGGTKALQTADFTASDFSSESWVEIKDLESLGSLGDSAEEVAIDIISEQRTKRLKGTRQSPPMEVSFGLNVADPGQVALIAAERTRNNYAFKIEFPDAPQGGTPSQRLFIAIVGSASEGMDGANNVVRLNAQLWVNSNVVRVAAAPA